MILILVSQLLFAAPAWPLSCGSSPTRAGAMCSSGNCEIHFILEKKIDDGLCARLASGFFSKDDLSFDRVIEEFQRAGVLKDLHGPYEVAFDQSCLYYARYFGKVSPPIDKLPENCISRTKITAIEGNDLQSLKRRWWMTILYSWARDPILLFLLIIGLEFIVRFGQSRSGYFRVLFRFGVGFLSIVWPILWFLASWYPFRWLLFPLALIFYYFRMRAKWGSAPEALPAPRA